MPVFSRFNEVCEEAGLSEKLKATDVRHYFSTYLTEEMTEEEREVFFRFMGHSREISKNVYSCRPVLKTMSLLSRIHKTLDLNRLPENIPQCSSPDPVPHSKVSRKKRPLVIESDTEEEKESVPQSKRLRWDAEDSRKISRYFKEYITPNGKKCAPESEAIRDFLSKDSCSKSIGSNVSFNYAKTMIIRKINNNRRLFRDANGR